MISWLIDYSTDLKFKQILHNEAKHYKAGFTFSNTTIYRVLIYSLFYDIL